MTSRFRYAVGLALVLGAAPGVAHATDDLAFHPCLTEREQAFIEVELKRGPAPTSPADAMAGGWEYAVVDLDEDGVPEVAVRPTVPCDGPACRTAIYTRIVGDWVRIFESADRDLSVARKQTKGYREILTPQALYRWSGKGYRPVS